MFKFCFLICVNFLLLNLVSALPRDSNFIERDESCKAVCGICECEGYYCGDECICECNLTTDDKLECIIDMKKECAKNGLEYELILQGSKANSRTQREAGDYIQVDEDLLKQFRSWQKRQTSASTAKPLQNDSIVAAPVIVQPGYGGDQLSDLFSSFPGTLSFAIPNFPSEFDIDSIRDAVLGTPLLTPLTLPLALPGLSPLPALTPVNPLGPLPSFNSLTAPRVNLPTLPPFQLPAVTPLVPRQAFNFPTPRPMPQSFPRLQSWVSLGSPNPDATTN